MKIRDDEGRKRLRALNEKERVGLVKLTWEEKREQESLRYLSDDGFGNLSDP